MGLKAERSLWKPSSCWRRDYLCWCVPGQGSLSSWWPSGGSAVSQVKLKEPGVVFHKAASDRCQVLKKLATHSFAFLIQVRKTSMMMTDPYMSVGFGSFWRLVGGRALNEVPRVLEQSCCVVLPACLLARLIAETVKRRGYCLCAQLWKHL